MIPKNQAQDIRIPGSNLSGMRITAITKSFTNLKQKCRQKLAHGNSWKQQQASVPLEHPFMKLKGRKACKAERPESIITCPIPLEYSDASNSGTVMQSVAHFYLSYL